MDNRIYKTRKNLRDTLAEIMKTKDFSRITVKEICEKAHTSRVTFYTHYDDKTDLLRDLCEEIIETALARFREMQAESNPDKSLVISMQNVLDSILYAESKWFHRPAQILSGPDALYFYYNFIMRSLERFESEYEFSLPSHYPTDRLNAFIGAGVWSFLHAGDTLENGIVSDETVQLAHDLIRDLLDSRFYEGNKGKDS